MAAEGLVDEAVLVVELHVPPTSDCSASARESTSRRATARCARPPASRGGRGSVQLARLGAPLGDVARGAEQQLPRPRCTPRQTTLTSSTRASLRRCPAPEAHQRAHFEDAHAPRHLLGREVGHPQGSCAGRRAQCGRSRAWPRTNRSSRRAGRGGRALLTPSPAARSNARWRSPSRISACALRASPVPGALQPAATRGASSVSTSAASTAMSRVCAPERRKKVVASNARRSRGWASRRRAGYVDALDAVQRGACDRSCRHRRARPAHPAARPRRCAEPSGVDNASPALRRATRARSPPRTPTAPLGRVDGLEQQRETRNVDDWRRSRRQRRRVRRSGNRATTTTSARQARAYRPTTHRPGRAAVARAHEI